MKFSSIPPLFYVLIFCFGTFLISGYQYQELPDSRKTGTPFIGNQLFANEQQGPAETSPVRHKVEAVSTNLRQKIRQLRGSAPVYRHIDRVNHKQQFLAKIAKMSSNESVELIIKLKDPGFDFSRFEEANREQIDRLVAERKAQLRPRQNRLIKAIRRSGPTRINRFWITNQLTVKMPARAVEAIYDLPMIRKIEFNEHLELVQDEAYGGKEARKGILTNAFINDGYHGETGGKAGGKIKVGIIELYSSDSNTFLLKDHYGFQDANGDSRVQEVYWCKSDTCIVVDSLGIDNHGSRVTFIAAGSIEDGQDPNPSFTTADKKRRSGIAPKTDIYYYSAKSSNGFLSAAQQAIVDGVDVLNYSASWKLDCSIALDYDNNGINEAMKNAVDSGIFFAKGAGNNFHSADSCSIWYPGWRSDAFIASSLNTNPNDVDYKQTDLLNSAPRGGIEMTTADGEVKTWSGIDMVLPASFSYYYTSEPDGYETTTARQGSSFAGPVAAATGGLLREIWTDKGWKASNARMIYANMLAMGDTWDAETNDVSKTEMSELSGAGRLRAYRPDSKSLTAPWGWGQRGFKVYQDSVYSFVTGKLPKSNSVQQWKWAILWSEPEYSAVADIVIMVVDTCPAAGGEEIIACDYSGGLRKRISLDVLDIGGKCIEFRVVGLNVPDGGRKIYSADFYHSGTPD